MIEDGEAEGEQLEENEAPGAAAAATAVVPTVPWCGSASRRRFHRAEASS